MVYGFPWAAMLWLKSKAKKTAFAIRLSIAGGDVLLAVSDRQDIRKEEFYELRF